MTQTRSSGLLLILFFSAVPALAEPAPPPKSDSAAENPLLDEARRAFADGRILMEERRFREAIEKFRMAAQVKETPGLRYYVAYCLEQLGELLEAQREYARSAELLAEFEANDVRELLPEAQDRVNRALPSLTIVDTAPGDVVQVDGSVVRAGEAVRVNPGQRTVRVIRADHSVAERSIELGRGQVERISVSALGPKERRLQPAPPAEPSAPRSNSLKPVLVWSGVGLAAAGASVGLGGFFLRSGAHEEIQALSATIDGETGGSNPCSSSGEGHPDCDALEAAGDRYNLGQALFISGVVGGAVGLTGALLGHFLWPQSKVEVGAALTPSAGIMSVRGRF